MRRSLPILAIALAVLVLAVGCKNRPPVTAAKPVGPDSVALRRLATYSTQTTDPNKDQIQYIFDWRDGSFDTTDFFASGAAATAEHKWMQEGLFYVRVLAIDDKGNKAPDWSESLGVVVYLDSSAIENDPPAQPAQPAVTGPLWRDSTLTVTSSATDPDGDSVSVKFYYGDNMTSAWSAFVPSGTAVSAQVVYPTRGTKTIYAVARDVYGDTSVLSDPTTVEIQGVNTAPEPPRFIAIPARGIAGGPQYRFYVYGYDGDGDSVRYKFTFGTNEVVTGYFASGATGVGRWQPTATGAVTVRVQAQDAGGLYSATSAETTFTVVGEGEILWLLDGSFTSSVALGTMLNRGEAQTAALVGNLEGVMYFIDAYMGPNERRLIDDPALELDDFNSSATVGATGVSYIGNANGAFYSFSTACSLKWQYPVLPLGNDFSTTAAIDGNTIYFGGDDKKLHKLVDNGATYSEEWSGGIDLHNELSASPVIGPDGNVVAIDDSGYCYKLSPAGAVLWSFATGEVLGVTSSPAVVADGTIYVGTETGKLLAIKDGAIVWSYEIPATPPNYVPISGSPIVGLDGHVYFAAEDGKFYNIDPNTRTVEPNWPVLISTGAFSCTPVACADGMFYLADDDSLYAVSAAGAKVWSLLLEIPLRLRTKPGSPRPFEFDGQPSPVVDQYGIIYVATESGLFAVAGRSAGHLASTPWPMFHRDIRHTGKYGAR
jgi:hypothetical protein